MITLKVQGEYLDRVSDKPFAEDIRSGIMAALRNLYGQIGASEFIWDILRDSIGLENNLLTFSIDLVSPSDAISVKKFGAAVSFGKLINVDKVVLRVVG